MIAGSDPSTRHPFVSLLSLLLWIGLGMTVFTILGVVTCGVLYGFSGLVSFTSGLSADINGLKIIQLFSSIGTFIIPAIIFARQESKSPVCFLQLNRQVPISIIATAIFIYFAFVPFIEWTIVQNAAMKLPSVLKDIEMWMKQKEDEMATLTKQFLTMKSPGDLIINLIIIAIIPGIGEELIFRGCMQKIFVRWTKNAHAGIWIAAIIFSAIHVQFYGFIPRMLLGALFGYLFYLSKSMAIPMIAHSINNGTAVIGAYVMQQRGESLDMIDKQSTQPFYLIIISFFGGLGLLLIYKRLTSAKEEVLDEERLD